MRAPPSSLPHAANHVYPRLARALFGAALVVLHPFALQADAQVPAQEYAARRAALLEHVDSGVVIAHGEVDPVSDWPTFFQLPHFHYLTGFDEGNAVLLMVKRGGGTELDDVRAAAGASSMARILGKRTPAADLQRTIGIAGRDIGGLRAASTRSSRPGCRCTSCPTCTWRTSRPRTRCRAGRGSWRSSARRIRRCRSRRSTAS